MDYRLYCPPKKSLLWFKQKSLDHFWDEKWINLDIKKFFNKPGKKKLVLTVSKKYLKPGSKILEGGCGLGQYVQLLNQHGFDAVGVDLAEEGIRHTLQKFPDLPILYGNVSELNFPDNYFDGYWSMGVIEHDINGFAAILAEMQRVIKPNGYLFLMFPYMSPLRRLKAKWNRYPVYEDHQPKDSFYQYYYHVPFVLKQFEKAGFTCVTKSSQNPYLGLITEINWVKSLLHPLCQYQGKSSFKKFLKYPIKAAINFLFKKFSANTILLVLQKNTIA